MAKNTVIVSVLADAKQFTKGLSDAGKEANGLGGIVKNVGLAAAAGLAVATGAAAALVAGAIKAAGESEKIVAQTMAVVKSTGAAAGRSVEQVGALATELSRLSGIDDEVVQSGENVLLTFTNIKGTSFDGATKSALNMSVALGTDMASASMVVGKALNDPIAGMSKLSKVGVTFTEQQKAQVAAMMKAGDVAGAQAVIIAELNKEYGGSAEAFGNTFMGAVGKAKTSLGNLQEMLGSAFLPVATKVFGKVSSLLNGIGDSPAFAAALTNVTGFISGLLAGDGVIGKFIDKALTLASTVSPLGLVFKALAPILPSLAAMFATLAGTIGGALAQVLPTVTKLAAGLASVLSGAFAIVLPIVLTLAGQLAGVLGSLAPVFDLAAGAAKAVGTALSGMATWLGQNKGLVIFLATAIISIVAAFKAYEIVMAAVKIATVAWAVVQGILNGTLIANPIGLIITAIGLLVAGIIWVATQTTFFQDAWATMVDIFTSSVGMFADFFTNTIGMFRGFFTNTVGMFSGFVSNTVGMVTSFGRNVLGAFSSFWSGTVGMFSTGIGNIIGFFGGLPGQVLGAIGSLTGSLVSVGKNMIQGLINGATGMLGNLGSFVSGLVSKYIVGPVKSLLGIKSPSRVFMQIGDYTMQGLEIGLRNTSGVRSAVDSLGKELAATTLPAPRVSSSATRESSLTLTPATPSPVSQMSASDRMFFRELFQEFAGSLTVTDGVIAGAANSANARMVKAGAR